MFGQDFTCPALLEDRPEPLPVRGCHPLWRIFPDASGSFRPAAGLVRVRSPLLTESRLMSFPPVTEMFQLAGFASRGYGFAARYRRSGGLPHSEIPGSKPARGSPGLIAACYVLHRLSVPRHPPNALLALEPRIPCAGASPPRQSAILSPSDPCAARPLGGGCAQVQRQTSSRCQNAAPPGPWARGGAEWLSSRAVSRAAVVEANGIEPMTSCLQSRRSPD